MRRFPERFLVVAAATLVAFVSSAPAASVGWSTPVSVDPLGEPAAVSCPSGTFCVAVDTRFGAAGYVLTFDGSRWSAPMLVDSAGGLNDVSCPTASFCVAVAGNGQAFTYDGSNWSASASLGEGEALTDVSCASSSFCVATGSAGNSGNVFTYDGSGWSGPVDPDAPNVLGDLSCPTDSFCAAVDNAGNVLTFNGSAWSAPDPIGDVGAISCPTSSFCIATDGTEALTYDDGAWAGPVPILPGGGLITDVSCSSSSFCAAVSQGDQAMIYDGGGWSTPDRIVAAGDGSTQLSSVSCAGSFCATVDRAGNALTYPVSVAPPSSAPIHKPQPTSNEPLAPSDFRPVKVTASSITLSWKPPTRGGRPAGYGIAELAPNRRSYYVRAAHLGPNTRRYTVRGLRPRTRYRFRIESLGADGRPGHRTTGRWVTTAVSVRPRHR